MKRFIILFFALSFMTFSCKQLDDAVDKQAMKEMEKDEKKIVNKMAEDDIQRFEMAKKSGDKMEICVTATAVVQTYLIGKDEPNYLKWKKTEQEVCKEAGVPIKE